jgi:hypothetical protein
MDAPTQRRGARRRPLRLGDRAAHRTDRTVGVIPQRCTARPSSPSARPDRREAHPERPAAEADADEAVDDACPLAGEQRVAGPVPRLDEEPDRGDAVRGGFDASTSGERSAHPSPTPAVTDQELVQVPPTAIRGGPRSAVAVVVTDGVEPRDALQLSVGPEHAQRPVAASQSIGMVAATREQVGLGRGRQVLDREATNTGRPLVGAAAHLEHVVAEPADRSSEAPLECSSQLGPPTVDRDAPELVPTAAEVSV